MTETQSLIGCPLALVGNLQHPPSPVSNYVTPIYHLLWGVSIFNLSLLWVITERWLCTNTTHKSTEKPARILYYWILPVLIQSWAWWYIFNMHIRLENARRYRAELYTVGQYGGILPMTKQIRFVASTHRWVQNDYLPRLWTLTSSGCSTCHVMPAWGNVNRLGRHDKHSWHYYNSVNINSARHAHNSCDTGASGRKYWPATMPFKDFILAGVGLLGLSTAESEAWTTGNGVIRVANRL